MIEAGGKQDQLPGRQMNKGYGRDSDELLNTAGSPSHIGQELTIGSNSGKVIPDHGSVGGVEKKQNQT